MTVDLDEFRSRQREVWGAGDYSALSPYIADVGELVATRAEAGPGLTLLDVASGTGNVARPAARAGARVTALDLVPALIEAGRRRAADEGLQIEWREGDAENLPFPDGAFDRVCSTFGHMFAPRHQRTADEMIRVCRPHGAIVTATWLPDGSVGEVFAISASFMPPSPDYASPPILWGNEEYVRERFARAAREVVFERRVNRVRWDSVDGFADFFFDRFPPLVTARAMLGDRFQDLRRELIEVWRRRNSATDGSFDLPQEYLVSLVRL